jgi:hypothetical protein
MGSYGSRSKAIAAAEWVVRSSGHPVSVVDETTGQMWEITAPRSTASVRRLERRLTGTPDEPRRASPDERKTMSTVLKDPVHPADPRLPNTPLDRAAPALRLVPGRREDLSGYRFEREGAEAAFELESPGGYARTVVGTFAYFDARAETYFVREHGGGLVRVPVRDIKATRVASAGRLGAHSSCLGSKAQEIVRTFVGYHA